MRTLGACGRAGSGGGHVALPTKTVTYGERPSKRTGLEWQTPESSSVNWELEAQQAGQTKRGQDRARISERQRSLEAAHEPCQYCERPMSIHKHESARAFRDRRFCGNTCAAKARRAA